jgi:hypothetical protein
MENYDRETADRILDIYNASQAGEIGLSEARLALVEVDPVLIDNDDWLVQQAYLGAKDIGGYPVSGKSTDELKRRISSVGGPESLSLLKELIRVGSSVVDQEEAFKNVADIAPQFLDVPGITFPPPYPFSNPRVRALFEHDEQETSHNLGLRRDGLYFVEDEEPIIDIIKAHVTGEIGKDTAKEKLREIHPGLLKEYSPPSFE